MTARGHAPHVFAAGSRRSIPSASQEIISLRGMSQERDKNHQGSRKGSQKEKLEDLVTFGTEKTEVRYKSSHRTLKELLQREQAKLPTARRGRVQRDGISSKHLQNFLRNGLKPIRYDECQRSWVSAGDSPSVLPRVFQPGWWDSCRQSCKQGLGLGT